MVHRRKHDHPRCLVTTAGDLRRFHPDLHDGHTLRCGILPDGIGAAWEGNPWPADVPILDDDGSARSDILSKFNNCVGLQMIENVPLYLELAGITIADGGGSGESATSTLFFLFGASSVIVELVFYLLGRFELGRVLYFFPKHVLVGCIGGIGLFIVVTALEVSTNTGGLMLASCETSACSCRFTPSRWYCNCVCV